MIFPRHRLTVFLLLALFSLLAPAAAWSYQDAPEQTDQQATEVEPDPEPIDLSSPRSTLQTFMGSMREHTGLRPDPRAIERALGAVQLPADLLQEARDSEIAMRVFEVLQYFETLEPDGDISQRAPGPDELPEEPVWSRTLRDAGADTPLVLVLREEGGSWRISEETTRAAVALYDSLDLDPLQTTLREWGLGWLISSRLLGLRYYHWLGLFVIILLGVAFDFTLRSVVHALSRRYLKPSDDDQTQSNTAGLIRRTARPAGLAGSGALVFLLIPLLQMPVTATTVLQVAAKAFALVCMLWAIYRLVDLTAEYFERKARLTATKFDDLLVPLFRKAVKIFVLAFGLVFIAESFNLPITSLVAGLGIGGLALAFAAKDTIENLFGSVAVILDRPFAVGDWVNVEGTEGIVEELGFRSTRIRTFYNSQVTMPNAALVRATVDNYGRRVYRRYSTTYRLTHDTDPDLLEAYCEGLREIIRTHPHTRKDYFVVQVNELGSHSIDVLIYLFFKVPDYSAEMRERHRFILDALRLARRLGVEYAFPTQTLHLRPPEPEEDHGPLSRKPEEQMRERGRSEAIATLEGSEIRRNPGS